MNMLTDLCKEICRFRDATSISPRLAVICKIGYLDSEVYVKQILNALLRIQNCVFLMMNPSVHDFVLALSLPHWIDEKDVIFLETHIEEEDIHKNMRRGDIVVLDCHRKNVIKVNFIMLGVILLNAGFHIREASMAFTTTTMTVLFCWMKMNLVGRRCVNCCATILDGKSVSMNMLTDLSKEIRSFRDTTSISPKLAVICEMRYRLRIASKIARVAGSRTHINCYLVDECAKGIQKSAEKV